MIYCTNLYFFRLIHTMLHTLKPLKPYRSLIRLTELAPHIKQAWRHLNSSEYWRSYLHEVQTLQKHVFNNTETHLKGDVVTVSFSSDAQPNHLEQLARNLLPWRIGPYQIGNFTIDAEWRSCKKWHRIKPLLGDLTNKIVGDVGCNNGYFLFQMEDLNPKLLVGFDPIERCWLQYTYLQALINAPQAAFVPTGINSLSSFPEFFDTLICMGVLYHQRDPFTACKHLYSSIKPGGTLILESLVIDQPGSSLLIPKERYAKMRNAWIIPTPEALESLMKRAGFSSTELHSFGSLSTDEQRTTEWAPFESLADFLDPTDPTKTIEGYPAPHTALVVAKK